MADSGKTEGESKTHIETYGNRPLEGISVVVTRRKSQASTISGKLRVLGADVIEIPVISITPAELTKSEIDKIKNIKNYDWIFLTSQNAIEPLFSALQDLEMDSGSLAGVKVASVGRVTSDALKQKGIESDLIPEVSTARGLIEAFQALPDNEKGEKVLLARADIASRELPDWLASIGIEVDEIAIYKTLPVELSPEMLRTLEKDVDYITIASSSSAESLHNALGSKRFIALSEKSKFISIGPVTSEKIRSLGARESCEAAKSDTNGLIEAIIADHRK